MPNGFDLCVCECISLRCSIACFCWAEWTAAAATSYSLFPPSLCCDNVRIQWCAAILFYCRIRISHSIINAIHSSTKVSFISFSFTNYNNHNNNEIVLNRYLYSKLMDVDIVYIQFHSNLYTVEGQMVKFQ